MRPKVHRAMALSPSKYSQNIPNEGFVTPISSIERHILLATRKDFQRFFEERHRSGTGSLIILSIINTIFADPDDLQFYFLFFHSLIDFLSLYQFHIFVILSLK